MLREPSENATFGKIHHIGATLYETCRPMNRFQASGPCLSANGQRILSRDRSARGWGLPHFAKFSVNFRSDATVQLLCGFVRFSTPISRQLKWLPGCNYQQDSTSYMSMDKPKLKLLGIFCPALYGFKLRVMTRFAEAVIFVNITFWGDAHHKTVRCARLLMQAPYRGRCSVLKLKKQFG